MVTLAENQLERDLPMKKITDRKAYCPGDYAFQRIGGKYKGRILWYLKDGFQRYGDLKRLVEGVSPKMLAQALRELEDDGIIIRKAYGEVPPRVEYTLSDIGVGLIPCIDQLRIWAQKQLKSEEI
jgi:DNA-binding HxlR family transcriptional regulator